MEQGLLVISNAKAGSADERMLHEVLDVLRRGGGGVRSEPLGSPDQLDALLGAHPHRLVVAAGGDGTLHLLVAALHARGELASRVIGLVPLGTGNDFARTVGIPLAAIAAARVVLQGSPREVDLLTDDAGGVVVNAVHLGHRRSRRSCRGAAETSARDARVPYRCAAGGAALARLADVVVSTAVGLMSRMRYTWLLRQGKHSQHPNVVLTRGRRVELTGPPIPINSDGELGDAVSHRRWTVQPRA